MLCRYSHLQKCYNRGWSTETRYSSTAIRARGMGGAREGMGTADEVRSQQQEIIKEQDKGLEKLSKQLRGQQRKGVAMQDEVQEQNGKLSRVNVHVMS